MVPGIWIADRYLVVVWILDSSPKSVLNKEESHTIDFLSIQIDKYENITVQFLDEK